MWLLAISIGWSSYVVAGVALTLFFGVAYGFYSRNSDVGEHPMGAGAGDAPGASLPSSKSGRNEGGDPSGSLDTHGTA